MHTPRFSKWSILAVLILIPISGNRRKLRRNACQLSGTICPAKSDYIHRQGTSPFTPTVKAARFCWCSCKAATKHSFFQVTTDFGLIFSSISSVIHQFALLLSSGALVGPPRISHFTHKGGKWHLTTLSRPKSQRPSLTVYPVRDHCQHLFWVLF